MSNITTLQITETDRERLENLIDSISVRGDRIDLGYARRLQDEIAHADVIPPEEIDGDVVTMRSKVRFRDLDTGEESVYTIVFPSEANIDEGKISILAPLASSLLGYKQGDTVRFEAPSRIRQLQISEIIYQPESSGHFHL